jgi:hypothetical protein
MTATANNDTTSSRAATFSLAEEGEYVIAPHFAGRFEWWLRRIAGEHHTALTALSTGAERLSGSSRP